MIDAQAKIKPEDLARFTAIMKEYAREAPLQVKAVVNIAAVAVMNSCPTYTPKAVAKRPVYEMSEPERNQWKSRPKYGIQMLQQTGYTLVPVFGNKQAANAHPSRVIKQRGLAKNSWRVLAGKIANGFALDGGIANTATAVSKNETALGLEITAKNMLKYIGTLNDQHNIIPQAFTSGGDALQRELELRAENWVQAKWRRMS